MTTSNATLLLGRIQLGPSLLDFPTETLHTIFTYLTPTGAANARLANKKLADIGIEYIVPEVLLVLSEDSFNKCEAIAQHPKIKEHVKSLVFNDIYLEDLNRRRWDTSVKRLERQKTFEHYHYTQDELDVAFARYQRHREEQRQLLQGDVYLERITKLLAEFHALKSIVLDTDEVCTGVGLNIRQLWAVFRSGIIRKKGTRPDNHCAGLSETHAILDNAHQAGLRLETFTCNLLGFRFFSDRPQDYASYGRSLIHLKSLDLVIYDMKDLDGFIACLSSGRVLRFLTAAPHLERLRLGIYLRADSPPTPANLEHFVGDFRWTSLVQVVIEEVWINKDGFREFVEKHSSTLKTVELRQMSLMDGTWTSIFQMMRTMLELDEVGFHGIFVDNDGAFDFDMTKGVADDTLRKNVHDYILGAIEDFQPIEAYLNEYRYWD